MILKKGVLFSMCVFFAEKWENGDFFTSQVSCVDETFYLGILILHDLF